MQRRKEQRYKEIKRANEEAVALLNKMIADTRAEADVFEAQGRSTMARRYRSFANMQEMQMKMTLISPSNDEHIHH